MVKIYSFSTDRKHCYYPNINVESNDLKRLNEILMPYTDMTTRIPNLKTAIIDKQEHPIGYRLVKKKDLSSLGLRGNTNILYYPINEWFYLSQKEILEGPQDWGGIAILRNLGSARWLQNYMLDKHSTETRLFKTAFKDIIHLKERSVKTNAILMYEEIFL